MEEETETEEQKEIEARNANVIGELHELCEDDIQEENRTDEAQKHPRDEYKRSPAVLPRNTHAQNNRQQRQNARQKNRQQTCGEESEDQGGHR